MLYVDQIPCRNYLVDFLAELSMNLQLENCLMNPPHMCQLFRQVRRADSNTLWEQHHVLDTIPALARVCRPSPPVLTPAVFTPGGRYRYNATLSCHYYFLESCRPGAFICESLGANRLLAVAYREGVLLVG